MYVVTGGSDGLGKALVSSLVDANQQVTNVSRRENSMAQHNVLCDLSTLEGIEVACESILSGTEPIEAIIVSAGVFSFCDLEHLDETEYERVFAINAKSPMLMISKLLPRIKSDAADIVMINSVAGLKPYANQSFYNASKAALRSFTDDVRVELSATGSRVIGVYPGMLDTNLAQKLPGGSLPKSKHPTIDPAVLADYIVYTLQLSKIIEVTDLVIDRKKLAPKQ